VKGSRKTLEVKMFALLPVLGGFLVGWLAPRRIAVPAEIALFAVGAVVFVLSSPNHGTSYLDGTLLCIPVAAVSAGTTALGLWLRRRHARAAAQ
jgi:hypothetical protein